jgi:8-oxo-dGTP diphosphatase
VFQVRDGDLTVLLWKRAREPFTDSWALPGGTLASGETLEASISRHRF